MKSGFIIEKIINGHDYFYCIRAKCRLRLSICLKRQKSNKKNITEKYSLYMCERCPQIREKCRLHLPVCLKSEHVKKIRSNFKQAFLICENCPQGKENICKATLHDLSNVVYNAIKTAKEGKDKGIEDDNALPRQNEEGTINIMNTL
ncbi:MAG: hypothetical protein AB2L12_16920 [Smithellaceae bacterium]